MGTGASLLLSGAAWLGRVMPTLVLGTHVLGTPTEQLPSTDRGFGAAQLSQRCSPPQ